jgi:uncharacterized membrane protein YedE/YeeE
VQTFTPIASTFGGILIGLAATVLMKFNGRIAGISNILGGLIRPARGDWQWRFAFIAGLLAGAGLLALFLPETLEGKSPRGTVTLAAAGLLVGAGARLANGCTSGHGVSGIARLSLRSFVATLTFMATAIATVFIFDHVIGNGGAG